MTAADAKRFVEADVPDLKFYLGLGAGCSKGWDGCPVYRTDRKHPQMVAALYLNFPFVKAWRATTGMFAVGMVRGDDGYEERLAIENTCELLPEFDRICREGFVATRGKVAYSFCGPTVLDGKAKRNMMGSSFKRCPDPLTDAPWASFSDRSFLDRCWSEPNFLSRAGPEVLVAESVTAVRIRVG